ncbi:MAG TPA: O-antigen ligase family protein [Phycisphaerae bacterium]|nr:O-antigen ligase family protein [Phycisphaerae bacterium]HRY69728.1 O-antigen ligase family protein [Phycisphaerae bacterium]HSA29368.1 O-antigen ligase family protein [Phycisphaerae bacterium]
MHPDRPPSRSIPAASAAARLASTAPVDGRQRIARVLERVALFVLLMLLAMRPLLGESYDSSLNSISAAVDLPDTINPATTAWFDLAIWAAGILVAGAAVLSRRAWRWTGLEAGWLLLILAAVVSTFFASNRRLALNGSADWLAAVVLVFLVANLSRDRLRTALVLAVLVASGVATAARSGMQATVEFKETWDHYQKTKEEFWRRQGIQLTDARVDLFERRMKSREASGFFPFSNAQAALLAMCGFSLLGLLALRRRARWQQLALAVLAVLLFLFIPLTGSKAGCAAGLLGLLLAVCLWRCSEAWRPQWRKVLALTWLAIVACALLVTILGFARGGLPGDSLNFRWQYWQVTGRIIADTCPIGTGALNYDWAYLLHKPVEYPEEIKDPHNFVLSTIAQGGVFGGLGLLTLLAGGSLVVARTWGGAAGGHVEAVPEPETEKTVVLRWAGALIVGFFLLRIFLFRGLWLRDASGQAMVMFDLGLYGVLWAISLGAFLWLSLEGQPRKGDHFRIPILCAVLVFLLHNTIDSSMFFAGTLTPFAALGGLLLACADARFVSSRCVRAASVVLAVATAGFLAHLALNVIPVSRCRAALTEARSRSFDDHVLGRFAEAFAADRLDPTPWSDLAAAFFRDPSPEALTAGLKALDEAIRRDPRQISHQQYRMRALEAAFQAGGTLADLQAAIAAGRRCTAMYPASPDHHLELAALLDRARTALSDPALLDEAVREYREALRLNDARPAAEPRRWSAEHRRQVQSRLEDLLASRTRPAG